MAEIKRMKSPLKSLDVFEFREEEELAEMAAKQSSAKIGCRRTTVRRGSSDDHVSGNGTQSKEIGTGICMDIDASDIDYNLDATGSVTLIETEDFTATPDLNRHLYHELKSRKQATDVKSNTIDSGSVFTGMDMSVSLTSDAGENMSERSLSAIATSPCGPSSHGRFSGLDLDRETAAVVFYADYLEYCGTHYLDSVVRFSRSFIEARSKTIYGKERTYYIQLEVEDIVKIESQWSARYQAGTINIYFISKDAAGDKILRNASGIQELKFPAVDSDWYQKQEAIESLDMRYKAVWSVLLDTGMENCSALPKGEAMMLTGSYFPNFDKPFQEVIYPKDDPDAVSISKKDVDLLLPDTFVNDTIIDFYIKYLKTGMSGEKQNKFHFFNSFFFRKLADMDKDSSCAFDGKAAFQRVRKWTRKVNLLEKDFIFIPVNYNYHWSLIVICYFCKVASYEDAEDSKSVQVPCILHMDSLRGNHLGLKDLTQSYLWEEWRERQKEASEDLYSKFRNLKFIPLELPQQQNAYDCGLFLLHYVELFLEEVPADFNIYRITSSSKFLQADWFPPGEASMKRTRIERLINGLLETHSEHCATSGPIDMQSSPECPNNAHDCEDGVKISVKSGPLQCCHESSQCEVGQGIEMTKRSTRQTRISDFYSQELFEQVSASEALDDASWEALGNKAFSHEYITEEGRKTSEPFVLTESAEPAFPHLDGVTCLTPETHTFPSSCQDFTLEPAHRSCPMVDTSLVSSGKLHYPTQSLNQARIHDQVSGPSFWKNLEDFKLKANQLQARHSSAFSSGNKSGITYYEHPYQTFDSCDQAHPCALVSMFPPISSHEGKNFIDHESTTEPAAKRIRITSHDNRAKPVSCTSNIRH